MQRLSQLPQPFIVCVLTDRTAAATVTTMRLALHEGADAYEVNLPALAAAAPDELRRIFGAVDQPVYTSCRRADFMTVYGFRRHEVPDWDDEERMARQLDALRWGSVAIDIEMDTFDPHPAPPLGSAEAAQFLQTEGDPAEVTFDAAAIARQKEIVDAAHEAGGEVIFSCHTGRRQSKEGLIELVELAAARGADLIKIVSPCPDLDDLWALLAATAALQEQTARRGHPPFVLVGAGENGTPSRTIGPLFGSGWALCQYTLQPDGFHPQPLVEHEREILRLIPWRYDGKS